MSTTNKRTILLVEDEPIIAISEKMQLEKYGYRVMTVPSGEDAVRAVGTTPDIDLILMDINLGDGIDGTEAAGIILKDHDIPIVFLSSHTEPEIVEKTEKIASYGYVVKNSSITVLDASIKMAFKLFAEKIESKQKEKAIYEHEMKYRLLHEHAGIGIGYYTVGGTILSYNRLAAKHMGGVPEDFSGKSLYDLFPKHDADIYVDRLRRAAASEAPNAYEDKVALPTGDAWFLSTFTKIVDTDRSVLGIQIISQEITDLKRAEEALRDSAKRLEGIIEGTHVGTWEWNVQTGETVFNQVWAEMIGYTLDELAPISIQTWIEHSHPEDLKESEEILTRHFAGEMPFYECECRMRHRDGRWIWVLDKGKAITWTEDGKPLMMFGTHTDITSQRQAEQRVSDLLEEKELILKEVHHRIKNSMNTVSSLLTLQADRIAEPAAVSALKDAADRIQSMSLLYDKLYRSTDYRCISLREYLPPLVEKVVSNFPNSRIVKWAVDAEDFVLDAKRMQTVGIIVNEPIANAMKYAFAGREHGSIAVTAKKAGDRVRISVQDDGAGIPENITFENSAGFGLQLAAALTAQLKGALSLERDKGTKIVLEFSY